MAGGPCPLCGSGAPRVIFRERGKAWLHCPDCDLRFLDPAGRLSPEAERGRYLLHNNDIHDPRYQAFVRPLFEQVSSLVPPGSLGLDFGAGTGPVLAHLLGGAGYRVRLYDPHFHPDPSALEGPYDFVAACEVLEHLREPRRELERLRRLLSPGGLLGAMTWLWEEGMDFGSWSYRLDPTHVCFFSRASLVWAASRLGFSAAWFPGKRLALLRA